MQKWKENLRDIEPYVPGEQPQNKNVIKLNFNSPNAYAIRSIIKNFGTSPINI